MDQVNITSLLFLFVAFVLLGKVVHFRYGHPGDQNKGSESTLSRFILAVSCLFISLTALIRNGVPVRTSSSWLVDYGWTAIVLVILLAGLYYLASLFRGNDAGESQSS